MAMHILHNSQLKHINFMWLAVADQQEVSIPN